MSKIALIIEGGGMKCSFASGVLDVFLDEKIEFEYGIGISAGAACMASYQAGQRDRNRRFFCEHLKDKEYLGVYSMLTTGSIFGLKYIYADCTNEGGKDPLDYDALMQNPAKMYFPATDAATGKAHFFEKHDMQRNHYEPIMATCCLPAVCKPIEIEGKYYYDGGVADSIPIQKALDDGCDKVVVIMSKPTQFRQKPQKHRWYYKRAMRRFPKAIEALDNRYINYNASWDLMKKLEAEGKAFVFYENSGLEVSTYTKDPETMKKLYDYGFAVGKEKLEDLKAFMEK